MKEDESSQDCLPKSPDISKEITGNTVTISGEVVDGSLSAVVAGIEGPDNSFKIEATVVRNGDGFIVSGVGNYLNGPLEGELNGSIETDGSFMPDPSSLIVGGSVKVSKEISGILINLSGLVEQGSLKSLSGTIQGPNGTFIINASVVDNGDTYTITGGGAFAAGPVQGNLTAEILADKSFSIDPSTLNISGDARVNTELMGIKIDMTGVVENGSLASLTGVITGPDDSFTINASVVDNGNGYTISGSGVFTAGPIEGNLTAEIQADSGFNIDPSTLNIGGGVSISKEILGNQIDLSGSVVNGSLASIVGTIAGPSQSYLINASVVDNGDTYTITGSGAFEAGPVQGSINAQIDTDSAFNIDPSSLVIGGSASVNTEISGILINLSGLVEQGSLKSLSGTIQGPNGTFIINASVVDNGDTYTITGGGAFAAGPVQGNLTAEILADKSFSIDPSTLNISGDARVNTELMGIKIDMTGVVENGSLASLTGVITGPDDSFTINASVVDNGNGYTISGSGVFTAGPIEGNLTAEIQADSGFNIDPSTLNIGGGVSISKEILGNQIDLSGSVVNGSLASIVGTIAGPSQSYLINASVVDNGDTYTITGSGAFEAGPVQGSINAQIDTDSAFNIDPSSLVIGGSASVNTEISGILINLSGLVEQGSLKSLSGTIQGPNGTFIINASVVDNGDTYTITGGGAFAAGPVQGNLTAEILADKSFSIDPSTLNISGDARVNTELMGIKIDMTGVVENGSLASLTGVITGPDDSFTINASVVDNGNGYTISGSGVFTAGPIEGNLTAEIQADSGFNIDPSTLNIGGGVSISKEILGNQIDLSGSVVNGSLASIVGTIAGPSQSYLINASVVDNGDTYTITGSGAFEAGPVQGSINAQIDTDSAFNIDPSSLVIGGSASVNTEISGILINLSGLVEQGSLKSLSGTIQGPNGTFIINASVVDNGDTYTITGGGAFAAGPVQGNLTAEILADKSFSIDPSTLNISGDARVNTELMGIKIDMTGVVENGSLASLTGVITGPDDSFTINASVVDNGNGYTISGSGVFTAGPIEGNLTAEIQADSGFNIDPSTLNIGGGVSISKEILGNQIDLSGSVVNGSLASIVGTIAGPSQSYLINASVVDNGDTYTITGSGAFEAGPVQGSINAQIDTDSAFNIDPSSLVIGGSASVNTEISGILINLSGLVEQGSLKSLSGTIQGPNGTFIINASVVDNGDTYTITGGGAFAAGPVQGNLTAEILADKSFSIDPSTLNISGDARVNTELMGIKIDMTGVVENGSLASLTGVITGPDDSFTINASVVDNGNGYTISGSGVFTAGPIEGNLTAEIQADSGFNIDPSTLNIGGGVSISKEILGNQIDLSGSVVNGSLASIVGTIAGPSQSYLINASVVDNGDTYTITGSGAFEAGPVQGSINAQIDTDSAFNIDPSSLVIGGSASVNTEISGILINLSGLVEQGSLKSLSGTIQGPNGTFIINASVVDNGDTYTITGGGAFAAGPVQGNLTAEILADKSFSIDPSTLNISGDARVNTELMGIKIDMTGVVENGSLASLTGVITGPDDSFTINASVVDNGNGYTISGSGVFTAGPIEGNLTAEIQADSGFNIDPSTLNIGGGVSISKEILGNQIDLSGSVVNGSLASIVGTIAGPSQSYLINASVVDNGDTYTITGSGAFEAGPVQGSINAQIDTDSAFNIDPSSLVIGGSASVNTEISGILINLSGLVEQGSLKSLSGTIQGPNGTFIINASVVDNGDTYTITGGGAFAAGPVQGNLTAEILADKSFSIDPSTLNISGDARVNTELMGIKIDMTGVVENGSLASLTGVITGPDDFFTINASVVDNGGSYTIQGGGVFTAGPIEGNVQAEILTDESFTPDIASLNLSGNAQVNTEIAGNIIDMAGTMENGSLKSLEGAITGPNNLYSLTASVIDNGDTYTIAGSGEFTAGPIVGTIAGEIQTDKNFNPDFNSVQIGGEASVDTDIAGNKIVMDGTMENGSLQSLIGTIEGPNGLYLLAVSVVDNGDGYTITGGGAFSMGPVEGQVTGEIQTDANFNPNFDTLNVGGEATVDTEIAGHHISMTGVMVNGSLASLIGTIEGPNNLYVINASVIDNGGGYTLSGEGSFSNGPIEGSVNGTINTDPNFAPDFSSLSMGGEATIETEVAGNKVDVSATVNNGFLENISGTIEGPGGLYNISARGVREGEDGYDMEAAGAFTFFDEHFAFEPPAILMPAGIPGVFIEVSSEIGFGAKASADMVTGFKTDSHFIPDFSTFEIRSATVIGHGDVSVSVFGGISVGLPFAKVSAGIKAELKGVIDAMLTLTADSKGIKVSGSLYAALIGALYAAVKMKFLFFKKEFDFLIVEGKVASLEKEFGPTDFTIGNILEGFMFGINDISIPGKDMKAKPPELDESSQDSDQVLEDAKSEDEDAKSEDDESKKDSDVAEDCCDECDDKPKEEEKEKEEPPKGKRASITQGKFTDSNTAAAAPIQTKSDAGQLPSDLKSGVEQLSGQNMSDVNVHKNSDKPAQLNAHAYAQGSDIHLGPGQEKHLPHEAWHVAQQKQGRVEPTKQLKSKILINDDKGLEHEADVMGQKALEVGQNSALEKDQDSGISQSKTDDHSGVGSIQKVADQSENVSQFMKLDTLANKRDKDGLHQLQMKANNSSGGMDSLQAHGLSNEEVDYSQPQQEATQSGMENQDEMSFETNEI